MQWTRSATPAMGQSVINSMPRHPSSGCSRASLSLAAPPYACVHTEYSTRHKSQSEIDPKIKIWIILTFTSEPRDFFPVYLLSMCAHCTRMVSLASTCCCLFKLLVSALAIPVGSVSHGHVGWGPVCLSCFVQWKRIAFAPIYCWINWHRWCGWRNCHFDFVILLNFQWQSNWVSLRAERDVVFSVSGCFVWITFGTWPFQNRHRNEGWIIHSVRLHVNENRRWTIGERCNHSLIFIFMSKFRPTSSRKLISPMTIAAIRFSLSSFF